MTASFATSAGFELKTGGGWGVRPPALATTSNAGPERAPEAAPESVDGGPIDQGKGPATSTAVPTKPRPVRPTPAPLPQWQVLLHNDDVNSMDYVVEILERVGRLQRPAATRCMIEAHTRGVGIVVTTHRERAEFLADQFRSMRLVVTIEPVR